MSTTLTMVCILAAGTSKDVRVDREVCGLNSLAVVAKFLNEDAYVETLPQLLPASRAPFSLSELSKAADAMGMVSRIGVWRHERRAVLSSPSILRVRSQPHVDEPDHYVACLGEKDGYLVIVDFPGTPVLFAREAFYPLWDGEMLYVSNHPDNVVQRVIWQLTSRTWGEVMSLASAGLCLAALTLVAINRILWNARSLARLGGIATILFAVLAASSSTLAVIQGSLLVGSRDSRRSLLEAIPKVVKVKGDEGNATVKIQLANRGSTAVTIQRVEQSCTCILMSNLEGKTLEPGATLPVTMEINVPKLGTTSQSVHFYDTALGVPLEVLIEAKGPGKLPLLKSPIQAVTYTNLTTERAPRTLVVETLEERDSEPWFVKFETELDQLVVRLDDLRDSVVGNLDILERQYMLSIEWMHLPQAREVSTHLHGITKNDHDKVALAFVTASHAPVQVLSPSVVTLSAGYESRAVVAFLAGDNWRVAPNQQLPDGLAIKVRSAAEGQQAIIGLRNGYSAAEKHLVRFVNDAGGVVDLPVMILGNDD